MKIHVHKRSGKHLATLQVKDDATVESFKDLFYAQRKVLQSRRILLLLTGHYYPERQRFTMKDRKRCFAILT